MNVFDIEIVDFNEDGDGVGKNQGFTWFVKGGVPGDKVKCQTIEKKKKYGYAKLQSVLVPSKGRIHPPCPYFERCGGCQIQNYQYTMQLKYKQSQVENALKRIGGFDAIEVKPTLGMERPERFRNKGAYQVKPGGVIGFYEPKTHRIINVEDCLVQDVKHAAIIKAFKHYMTTFKVPAYDERNREGLIKHLVIRNSDFTGEVMVTVVTAKAKFPMTKSMADILVAACPEIVSVNQSIQPEHTSKILGETSKLLYGKATISDRIGDLDFQISPLSFFQVNTKQAKALYDTALDFAGLTGTETVLDLYSGTGTLTLFLAQKAKHVFGIEVSADATLDAEQNTINNKINNTTFFTGSVEEVAPELIQKEIAPDVIVLDPPRSGCEPAVIERILELSPKTIVYVSCKPSTLARDLKALCDNGAYTLVEAQPVDLFCHTTGVETVVKLVKIEG